MSDEGKINGAGGAFIKFRCESCGGRIRVPNAFAGKKGKCPRCKNTINVPMSGEVTKVAEGKVIQEIEQQDTGRMHLDAGIFDVPKESEYLTIQEEVSGQLGVSEEVRKLKEKLGIAKTETVAERKLPWLIDIFLYPTSAAGLLTFAVIMGVPIGIDVILWLLNLAASKFYPLIVFEVFLTFLGFAINIVIYIYIYWYYCECISDSAEGGLRAPEAIGYIPGVGELIRQLLRLLGCIGFFFLPAGIYFRYTGRTDLIFWLLNFYAVFFAPMGLLAVIVFDSIMGINPVLVMRSILGAFLPYVGLVLFYYVITNAAVWLMVLSAKGALPQSVFLQYLFKFINVYFLLVGAHLLGRFYWRYKDKLNWDV